MNPFAPPPTADLTEQIANLIWLLCQTVAERCRGPRVRTLTVEQVTYICGRLLAVRKRFRRVVALIRAGKPPKIRARKPPKPRPMKPRRETLAELEREFAAELPRGWRRRAREDRVRARAAEKAARALAAAGKPAPLWRALGQHRFGWLRGLVPQIYDHRYSAGTWANEMRRLLAEPEVQALLMAHPYVGEALREVCWALHIEGSLLHLRPKIPPAPVVQTPAPAVATLAEKIVSATPPAASMASAAQGFVPGAPVPPPPTLSDGAPSSQTLPGASAKDEIFAAG
jgi:hypothetical protein